MGLLRGTRRTLLSGNRSIFPLAFPASGTLYTATSDGTFTLTVNGIGTGYLNRVELWARVESVDSTYSWLLDSGWMIRAEYQTDDTIDVSLRLYQGGVLQLSVTAEDVGNVTKLRWVLSGNTLQAYYEIDSSGSFVQIGGDQLSGVYQTNRDIGASYNGAVGSELVVNGDMEIGSPPTGWTAGNAAILSSQADSPSGSGVSVLRVTYNGSSSPFANQDDVWSLNEVYNVLGYVRGDGATQPLVTFVGSGITEFSGTTSALWQRFGVVVASAAGAGNLRLVANGAGYAEFDEVSIIERGILDNGTDGPTLLEEN